MLSRDQPPGPFDPSDNLHQEFTRAILHLSPKGIPPSGTVRSSKSDTGDNDSLSPTVRARSASPPGYFDGMPGRSLGSSAVNDPRSPPPPYPGNFSRDNTSVAVTSAAVDQDGKASSVTGLGKTAANLSLDRDAMEERRAWSRRAGLSRVTGGTASRTAATPAQRASPVSSGVDHPAGEPGTRTSANNTSSRRRKSGPVHHGSDARFKSGDQLWGQGSLNTCDRTQAAAETEMGGAVPDISPGRKNEAAADVVSWAFERYARERDQDRHRDRRADKQSPQQRPASAPFALAPQTGGRISRHHRMPRASSDNDDGLESDTSSTKDDDSSYRSPFHHVQQQPQSRREVRSARVAPSKIYRDDPAGNGRAGPATGINSGDEGGGRTRGRSSTSLLLDKSGRSGQREGLSENKGNRSYGGGGEDESWEKEEDDDAAAAVFGSERERALRKAFDLYDLNGDGFITYLEVGDGSKDMMTQSLSKPCSRRHVLRLSCTISDNGKYLACVGPGHSRHARTAKT